jgi:hypothetical protein
MKRRPAVFNPNARKDGTSRRVEGEDQIGSRLQEKRQRRRHGGQRGDDTGGVGLPDLTAAWDSTDGELRFGERWCGREEGKRGEPEATAEASTARSLVVPVGCARRVRDDVWPQMHDLLTGRKALLETLLKESRFGLAHGIRFCA